MFVRLSLSLSPRSAMFDKCAHKPRLGCWCALGASECPFRMKCWQQTEKIREAKERARQSTSVFNGEMTNHNKPLYLQAQSPTEKATLRRPVCKSDTWDARYVGVDTATPTFNHLYTDPIILWSYGIVWVWLKSIDPKIHWVHWYPKWPMSRSCRLHWIIPDSQGAAWCQLRRATRSQPNLQLLH